MDWLPDPRRLWLRPCLPDSLYCHPSNIEAARYPVGQYVEFSISNHEFQRTSRLTLHPCLAVAIASFANSLGGALTISVGQNILVQGLRIYIPRYTIGVNTEAIVAAGAGEVQDLVPANQLLGLREAYALSLDHTFAFAIAAGGLALGFALCVSFLSFVLLSKRVVLMQ